MGAAVAPALVGFLTGALVVHHLGPDPITPRTSPVVCAGTSLRVCVWPEHRGQLATYLQVATTATRRWRAVGLHPPTRYSERDADASTGSARIGFSTESTPADMLSDLTIAVLPPTPACAETGPFLGAEAARPRSAAESPLAIPRYRPRGYRPRATGYGTPVHPHGRGPCSPRMHASRYRACSAMSSRRGASCAANVTLRSSRASRRISKPSQVVTS